MDPASNYIFEAMVKELKTPAIASVFIIIAGILAFIIPKSWRQTFSTSHQSSDVYSIKLVGLSLLLFGGYFLFNTYKDYKRIVSLRDNAVEGCATTMDPDFIKGKRNSRYTYKAGTDEYINHRAEYKTDEESYFLMQAGRKYVVIYDKTDPDQSILDGHRPLTDCK